MSDILMYGTLQRRLRTFLYLSQAIVLTGPSPIEDDRLLGVSLRRQTYPVSHSFTDATLLARLGMVRAARFPVYFPGPSRAEADA